MSVLEVAGCVAAGMALALGAVAVVGRRLVDELSTAIGDFVTGGDQ